MTTEIELFDDSRVPELPTHSHAARVGDVIYVAGQVGIALGTDGPPESFADEVEVALDALEYVLEAAGGSLATVARTNCYLADIDDMAEFNAIYLRRFKGHRPARSTIQARLANGLRFEIDAVAVRT